MRMLWLAVFAIAAAASEPEDSIFSVLQEEREIMVTTATRTETKLSETPSSTWVIDRDAIENSGATSIADLLRRVPGLNIAETGVGSVSAFAHGWGGDPFSHILYLIDGRSILAESFDETDLLGLPVALQDLERIEVVLGPASTLYGANASDAVINLLTRRAVTEGQRFRADVRGGVGTASVSGSTGSPGDVQPLGQAFLEYSRKLSAAWSMRLSTSADYFSAATVLTEPSPYPASPTAADRRISGIADFTAQTGAWSLRFQAMAVGKDGNVWTDVTRQLHTTDGSFTFSAERENLVGAGDSLKIQVWTRYQEQSQVAIIPVLGLEPVHIKESDNEINATYASPSFYHNRLVGGAQLRLLNAEASDSAKLVPGGGFQQDYSLFAEDQFRPWNWLIMTGGLRAEVRIAQKLEPTARFNLSPHGAVVVVPAEGHSLRIEYATAYRNPSVFEAFDTSKVPANGITTSIPNPRLLPEENQQLSFGYRGLIGRFAPRVEAFYGWKNGVVAAESVTAGTTLPTNFVNQYNQTYDGASAQLGVAVAAGLRLSASYTFMEVREMHPLPHLYTTTPKHLAGIDGRWTYGRIEASLGIYFQSQTTDTPPFGNATNIVTAARLIINPYFGVWLDSRHRLQAYAQGTNIGDVRLGGTIARDFVSYDVERVGPRGMLGVKLAVP